MRPASPTTQRSDGVVVSCARPHGHLGHHVDEYGSIWDQDGLIALPSSATLGIPAAQAVKLTPVELEARGRLYIKETEEERYDRWRRELMMLRLPIMGGGEVRLAQIVS